MRKPIEQILKENNFMPKYFSQLEDNHFLTVGNKGRFVGNLYHGYQIRISEDDKITYESVFVRKAFNSGKKAFEFMKTLSL